MTFHTKYDFWQVGNSRNSFHFRFCPKQKSTFLPKGKD